MYMTDKYMHMAAPVTILDFKKNDENNMQYMKGDTKNAIKYSRI